MTETVLEDRSESHDIRTLSDIDTLLDSAIVDTDSEINDTGYRERQQFLDNLRSARENLQTSDSGISLRPHQMNVYTDLIKSLENGASEGWIKLPTGAGKTALFATIAEASGLRTLVLVPNKNLVNQTAREFSRFAPDTSVSTFFSEKHSLEGQAVISTYQSLNRLIEESAAHNQEYDLVICDEAHRALGGMRPESIAAIPGMAFKLGLTATPEVSKTKSVSNLFGPCVHEMNLPDAISWGILTGVEVVTIQTNSDLSEVKFNTNGEASERALEKAIDFEERIQAVIEILQLPENLGKSFVGYWSSVQQAKEAARRLQEAGIPCCADTGDMDKSVRERNISDHRSGIVQGMATKKTLVEGWDAPIVEIAFMCHPTLSAVDAEQRLGRVLRPHTFPDNSIKDVAIVYDFIDRGKKGILASEVLGGTVRLAPERSFTGSEDISEEREPHHAEPITLSGGLQVFTEQTDVERLVNSYCADVRITGERLEAFLLESMYIARDQLSERMFTAESPRGYQQISGTELLENFAATHKGMEGVEFDTAGLNKLVRYCKWINDEVEVYLGLKKEVEAVFQNDTIQDETETRLERVLRRELSKLEHAPSISEFAAMRFPLEYESLATGESVSEVVAVSGQTILGFHNIRSGEEYLYYLLELKEDLDTPALSSLEERHDAQILRLNEIQVRLSEQLNQAQVTDARKDIARAVAQTVLSSLAFNTIEDLKDVTVNIKRSKNNPFQVEGKGTYQSVKFIGMYEYLEGLRRAEGIDANPPAELLSENMVAALATKSGRGSTKLKQEVVSVRQQRMALKELADAELLEEQIKQSIPNLALLSEEAFKACIIPGADGQPISGKVIQEYYTHFRNITDFKELVANILSPEVVDQERSAAREYFMDLLPVDLPKWRPETFLNKTFELPSGSQLSGSEVLHIFSFPDATAETFKAFAEQVSEFKRR